MLCMADLRRRRFPRGILRSFSWPVHEWYVPDHLAQVLGAVEVAPYLFGALTEAEHHGQRGVAR